MAELFEPTVADAAIPDTSIPVQGGGLIANPYGGNYTTPSNVDTTYQGEEPTAADLAGSNMDHSMTTPDGYKDPLYDQGMFADVAKALGDVFKPIGNFVSSFLNSETKTKTADGKETKETMGDYLTKKGIDFGLGAASSLYKAKQDEKNREESKRQFDALYDLKKQDQANSNAAEARTATQFNNNQAANAYLGTTLAARRQARQAKQGGLIHVGG